MKIKLIIFDLDGVLLDSQNIHFETLNCALKKISSNNFQISHHDHLEMFDGLSTKQKLNILLSKKKILKENISKIIKYKNFLTKTILSKKKLTTINPLVIKKLSKEYKIAVATNAIKATLNAAIKILKIKKYVSFKISSSDIIEKKPHPEIYLRCILNGNFDPLETLILEDSPIGREAAQRSGAHLMPIKNIKDVKLSNIYNSINNANKINYHKSNYKYIDNKMNILIPAAGEGKRFSNAGYELPKYLLESFNKTNIQHVVDSLNIEANYIFLVKKEHIEKYQLKYLLSGFIKNFKILPVDSLTEGAASTTLIAEDLINNKNPLIIANSDQFIEWNSADTLYKFTKLNVDGGILTFKSHDAKWSYAKINNKNKVIEVAEKRVISNHATAGVYYFKQGLQYVKYAKQMIKKNIRVNNEFYVCPIFNEFILDKKNIIIAPIKKMWSLGTPEDYENFKKKFKLYN